MKKAKQSKKSSRAQLPVRSTKPKPKTVSAPKVPAIGTCSGCANYQPPPPDTIVAGTCHLDNPTFTQMAGGHTDEFSWKWPHVQPTDWCSHWRSK